MRVLYLNHGLGYGGATKSLILMQQSLKDQIEIYTTIKKQKVLNREIVKEFVRTKDFVEFEIPLIYSHSGGTIQKRDFEKNKKFYPSQLINYIKEKHIDILHVNTSLFSHIIKPIKENTKCKVVVHIREMLPHGVNHSVDNYIISEFSEYADAIIAISDNEIRHFSPSHKIHIMPNPHDFEATDTHVLSDKKKTHKITIGMCANFLEIKGHLDFIEAAKIVNERFVKSDVEIEYTLIGYPIKKHSFKNLVKIALNRGYKYRFDNKVKQLNIINLRIVPHTFDIYKELAALDIYVRPDLTGNPWGRDIIEAMALKKPIVATGTSEFYVKNGITGYLVPAKNPELMADKLQALINNPQKRLAMGDAGYSIIKDMCSMEDYAKKMLSIYQSLMR